MTAGTPPAGPAAGHSNGPILVVLTHAAHIRLSPRRSAVVLYVVIKNWIQHTNSDMLPFDAQPGYSDYGTWVDLARIIMQMLVFGILYGCLWGVFLARMLRSVYNDKVVEISLTIAASYLCFWSAEMMLASSAVIAVVVMGFYLNLVRARAISPEVRSMVMVRSNVPSMCPRMHARSPARSHFTGRCLPFAHIIGCAHNARILRDHCVDVQHNHLFHRRVQAWLLEWHLLEL
jgi:hypothetical protein